MHSRGAEVLGADGKLVRVAWQPWEEELLAGALSEHADGDLDAIRDCAEFLCRSVATVHAHIRYVATRNKARELRLAKQKTSAVELQVARHLATEPFIRPPSQAQLMGGSTRVRTYNGWSTP